MRYYLYFLILLVITFCIAISIAPSATFACTTQCDVTAPNGFPLPHGEYTITAGYFDPSYFLEFHREHTGVDLIPNAQWYKIHPHIRNIILTSPLNGKFLQYHSSCGGNAAIVYNKKYQIYLGHISASLKQNNDIVRQGDPIAYMGDTGSCATGKHVHYEIKELINSKWILQNPLDYQQ